MYQKIQQPKLQIQSQNHIKNSKSQVFICTFLAYTSVHALRTTYSFNKSSMQIEQHMIGIVDSVMILFIGLGNFLIAVKPLPKPVLTFSIALLLCAIEYTFVPISMQNLSGSSAFAVLLLLMAISGFLQSFTWPNLLPIIHTVLSPDHDTILLGFWTTCTNFGNLLGFFICQYIVLENGWNWAVSMYIISGYMAINACVVWWRVNQISIQGHQNQIERVYLLSNDQQNQQFYEQPSILKVLTNSPKIVFLTLSFSLLKSVMYGILLWLPLYFYSIGLVDYSLYIPMTFDLSAIVGSTILGIIFKNVSPNQKTMTLLPVLFILLLAFISLKLVSFSVSGYFSVISVVGLCLGGSYNTMAGLVTMQLIRTIPPQHKSKYLRFYSALLMGFGNLITSFTQLIIGFTMGQDEKTLFGIFVVYTGLNIGCMGVAVGLELYGQTQKKEQQIQFGRVNKIGYGKGINKQIQIQITEIKPNIAKK